MVPGAGLVAGRVGVVADVCERPARAERQHLLCLHRERKHPGLERRLLRANRAEKKALHTRSQQVKFLRTNAAPLSGQASG